MSTGKLLAVIFGIGSVLGVATLSSCIVCAAIVGSTENSRVSSVESRTIPQSSEVEIPIENPNKIKEYHIATFSNGVLEGCIDTKIDYTKTVPEKREELLKSFDENIQKSIERGSKIIAQSCNSMFGDRTILASCLISQNINNNGIEFSHEILANYYDYASVGEDDKALQGCINQSGTWNSIDRNSSEWRRAKLEYNSKKLNDLAKRYESY